MIQNFTKLSLIVAVLVLLASCVDDNAFRRGIVGGSSVEEQMKSLSSLHENVLALDANVLNQAVSKLNAKVNTFHGDVKENDVKEMHSMFTELMQAWKGVQSVFIAADYDTSLGHHTQLFDFYRRINIVPHINTALTSSADIETVMFRNASRSMLGLEYLLFGDQASISQLEIDMNKNEKRRIDAIKVSMTYLQELSSEMLSFYANNAEDFSGDPQKAANAVVNALVDSMYKLGEWRIGEGAGLMRKFRDKPSPKRLEHYKSKLSADSMRHILKLHQRVMSLQDYENFGTFATANGAGATVAEIEDELAAALAIVDSFEKPIEELITSTTVDPRIKDLQDIVERLGELYFTSLIQALDLTAEFVEADGD